MHRRNVIMIGLVSATLIAGCDAIDAAKSVAVDAARTRVRSEIESAVDDAVNNALDLDNLIPQGLSQPGE